MWWYDGGELPPDAIREPIGARFPQQGSVVVGTEGMLVLPHMSPARRSFVLPDSKMAALPQIDLPERDHYGEFVDVGARRAAKEKCSSDFDYAGPLTESVHHRQRRGALPRRDAGVRRARAGVFRRSREANQLLTRSYRSGWSM